MSRRTAASMCARRALRLTSLAYAVARPEPSAPVAPAARGICDNGAVQKVETHSVEAHGVDADRKLGRQPVTNADASTVAGFGDEWTRFDQSALSAEEHAELFDKYFHIVRWDELPANAQAFDLGC